MSEIKVLRRYNQYFSISYDLYKITITNRDIVFKWPNYIFRRQRILLWRLIALNPLINGGIKCSTVTGFMA